MRKITDVELYDCVLALAGKLQKFTGMRDDHPKLDELMEKVENLLEPFLKEKYK